MLVCDGHARHRHHGARRRPELIIGASSTPGLHAMGLQVDGARGVPRGRFLSPADLMSVVIAFGIGIAIFVVGMRSGCSTSTRPSGSAWTTGTVRRRGASWRGAESCRGGTRSTWHGSCARVECLSHTPVERGATSSVAGVASWSSPVQARPCPGTSGSCARRPWYSHASARTPYARQSRRLLVRLRLPLKRPRAVARPLSRRCDFAAFQAERLLAHRMEVLRDFANANEIDSVRQSFPGVLVDARRSNGSITAISFALLDRRLSGGRQRRACGGEWRSRA